jgi:hypothetical protein
VDVTETIKVIHIQVTSVTMVLRGLAFGARKYPPSLVHCVTYDTFIKFFGHVKKQIIIVPISLGIGII